MELQGPVEALGFVRSYVVRRAERIQQVILNALVPAKKHI
jgi:hypothetical protein